MRISFFQKLFVTLLLSSVLLLAGASLLINASFKEGFQQYLNQEEQAKVALLAERVVDYYSASFGWQRLRQSPQIWASLLQQLGEIPPPKREHLSPAQQSTSAGDNPSITRTNSLFLPLGMRLNLLTLDGQQVLGRPENLTQVNDNQMLSRVAVLHDNEQVGWISVVQNQQVSSQLAESFLYSQSRHIFTIAFAALLVSLLVALLFVSYLLKPLRALHRGADAVQRGELGHRVENHGSDEIADLIDSFNQLVSTLSQQKQMREQWLSDISHELRTPLAVLRSELEAIQDGIRAPEPRYISSLHRQVLNLTALVDDLYALSLSDANTEKDAPNDEVDIVAVLLRVSDSYALRLKEKQIQLTLSKAIPERVVLTGNEQGLQQLFTNVLENSFRYTDPLGEVTIDLIVEGDQVRLVFADSAPSVPDHALVKLFDRLYRVDKSRSRASGGSGLGLSICDSIVKAHRGAIVAAHAPQGGLQITVLLPLCQP